MTLESKSSIKYEFYQNIYAEESLNSFLDILITSLQQHLCY